MRIKFSYETKYGRFTDSLDVPDDHSYSEEELELMKESRRDTWITYIDNIQNEVPVEEPIVEEVVLESAVDPTDPPPEELPQ